MNLYRNIEHNLNVTILTYHWHLLSKSATSCNCCSNALSGRKYRVFRKRHTGEIDRNDALPSHIGSILRLLWHQLSKPAPSWKMKYYWVCLALPCFLLIGTVEYTSKTCQVTTYSNYLSLLWRWSELIINTIENRRVWSVAFVVGNLVIG